jgi:hypothetical protein
MQNIDVRDYQYLIGKDARLPTGELVQVQEIRADGSAFVQHVGGDKNRTTDVCDVRRLTLDQ